MQGIANSITAASPAPVYLHCFAPSYPRYCSRAIVHQVFTLSSCRFTSLSLTYVRTAPSPLVLKVVPKRSVLSGPAPKATSAMQLDRLIQSYWTSYGIYPADSTDVKSQPAALV